MDSAQLWYVSRGTGSVALVLLTVSSVLGVTVRGGRRLPGLPRFAMADLHRNAALLSLLFLLTHIATVISDPYAKVGWLDAALPFQSTYRPLWVGLGAIAFDLFLAVVATSLVRERLGVRVWRTIHLSVYAAWPLGLTHALGSGSDNRQIWMLVLAALCLSSVAAAVTWRLSRGFRPTWAPS